ncbi:hypothetical protein [Saccharopolyspora taberi]
MAGYGGCGSGGCSRYLFATGDRAHEVMREHLASRGFTPDGQHQQLCRRTGVVATHTACASLHNLTADEVCSELTGY